MVKKFPHDYPLSKDLDLICDKKDFKNICMAAKTFASKYKNKYSIILLNYNTRLKIRFELSGFLCYQIDIGSEIDGINNPFVKKALYRRVKREGVFYFSEKDETLIRILEYVQTPNKKYHLEYIRKHKDILQTVLDENKHLFENDLEFIKQRLQEEERG